MNTFQHLKRDLIDGARFHLTVDSVTSRVIIEAIRSFQMARDHLRGELLGKDAAFDIGWRYSSPYEYNWESAISARVDNGIMAVNFKFLREGEYHQEVCSYEDQEFLVVDLLDFFSGGSTWKDGVRDQLTTALRKELESLDERMRLMFLALERIRSVTFSA